MHRYIKLIILFVVCCLSLNTTASAYEQRNMNSSQDGYILLLNFYRGSNEWANAIENNIAKHLISTGKKFYLKNVFKSSTDANKNNPNWWADNFNDLPAKKPDLVFILGDAGWILYRHYVPQDWSKIPCIILPARQMTMDFKFFSHNVDIDSLKMIPFEQTIKKFKAVAIYHQHYAKQTIDLIRTLQPSINKIVLISDNRLSSSYVRSKMKSAMKDYFKGIKYITINKTNYSTTQLLNKLQSFDTRTGIIFYGWYDDNETEGNVDYTKKMISTYSKVPIFTLTDFDTNNETSLCGGYYNSTQDLSKTATDMIDKFENNQYIPWGTIVDSNSPKKYLNFKLLMSKGIDSSLIPQDAVLFGKPLSFYERHRRTVWVIGILIAIMLFLILKYVITQRNLRHEREKEVLHLKRYEMLFNNMPIAYLRYFISKDDNGKLYYKILNKNKVCDNIFVSNKGVQSISSFEKLIFTPDEKDNIEKIAKGNPAHYMEVRCSECEKNFDVYICPSEKESVIDIFVLDKTKQIEALHKVIKYARMNNRILEMLPDDIIIFQRDHSISKLINHSGNKSALLLDNIFNKTSTHPNILPIINKFNDSIDRAFDTNELVGFDYEIKENDSSSYFKARLNAISNTQVCCNIHDYTEMMRDKLDIINNKKELEHLNHKLQIVLDAAYVVPWTLDLNKWKIIVKDTEYDVDTVKRQVHPDDLDDYNNCIEKLIQTSDRKGIDPHNIRINFDGRGYHWYKMRCIVDKWDINNKPTILIGSAEDVDKQKQIEINLIEAKEKAEESNKLKSAFIANMSHEIRTPLNAIIGFSEVLSSSCKLNEEEKALFRKNIAINKDLLMQLFSDILDLAKIDAGTIEFFYEKEDFTKIINNVISSALIRMKRDNKVQLVIDEIPESYTTITDPKRINQVITNFINNAIKFTASGTIKLGYRITEDNMIYCYVSDTGIGISDEQQEKIFERFIKLNSFKQGTGLGLSICKMIIEKMDGEIGVDSKQGQGSTFWFKIPILDKIPAYAADEV